MNYMNANNMKPYMDNWAQLHCDEWLSPLFTWLNQKKNWNMFMKIIIFFLHLTNACTNIEILLGLQMFTLQLMFDWEPHLISHCLFINSIKKNSAE